MRRRLLLGVLIGLAPLVACQGKPVALSAQRGATILIPLADDIGTEAGGTQQQAGIAKLGYGGAHKSDPQRGELVYRIDDSSNTPLVTVGTAAVVASPASSAGRGNTGRVTQVFSILNIPTSADLGTYNFSVTREWEENGQPQSAPVIYRGQISILDDEYDVDTGGGMETIEGMPTPLEAWACPDGFPCDWYNVTSLGQAQASVPDPELRIAFDVALWSVELTVEYDPDVMQVLDVIEPPVERSSHMATVWYQDDDTLGELTIGAVGGAVAIETLSIVFALDGSQGSPMDPASVSVTIDSATDEDGTSVSAAVQSKDIF